MLGVKEEHLGGIVGSANDLDQSDKFKDNGGGKLMLEKKRLFSILILGILIVGLIVGVILADQQQILRTRADVDVTQAFEIKDAQGKKINCSNNVCDIETLDVTIQLKPEGLDILSP